ARAEAAFGDNAKVRAQVDAVRAEKKAEHDRAEAALAECANAHEARHKDARAKAALESEVEKLRGEMKTSKTRIDQLEHSKNENDQRAARLERDSEHARAEATEARASAARAARKVEQTSAPLDRLLMLSRQLSSATGTDDVLTMIAKGIAHDFTRVAMFMVKGNALQGGYHMGFDSKMDVGKVVMPLTMDSLLTRAIASGHTEAVTAGALTDN